MMNNYIPYILGAILIIITILQSRRQQIMKWFGQGQNYENKIVNNKSQFASQQQSNEEKQDSQQEYQVLRKKQVINSNENMGFTKKTNKAQQQLYKKSKEFYTENNSDSETNNQNCQKQKEVQQMEEIDIQKLQLLLDKIKVYIKQEKSEKRKKDGKQSDKKNEKNFKQEKNNSAENNQILQNSQERIQNDKVSNQEFGNMLQNAKYDQILSIFYFFSECREQNTKITAKNYNNLCKISIDYKLLDWVKFLMTDMQNSYYEIEREVIDGFMDINLQMLNKKTQEEI